MMNTTMTKRICVLAAAAALFACGASLTGCKDDRAKSEASETVTAKTSPANPGDAPQPASPPAPPEATTAPTASDQPAAAAEPAPAPATPAGTRESADGVSWETPNGWQQGPARQMRLATITDGTAEIAVSSFGGNVGGNLANVNRWRTQIGLPPVESDAEAERLMTEVDVAGRKLRTVDLKGAENRILVAIVPGDDRLVFFRLLGPNAVVEARKPAFDQLVKTIRVE
jgi:hypothetical protein